jgi:hypothetical protein
MIAVVARDSKNERPVIARSLGEAAHGLIGFTVVVDILAT